MSNEDVANWWDDTARHSDLISGAVSGLLWDELWQEATIAVIKLYGSLGNDLSHEFLNDFTNNYRAIKQDD